MAGQSDRIHNAIYAAIATFNFPRVSYDPQTKVRTTNEGDTEKAETVLVRESTSTFENAAAYRRTPLERERIGWTWEAVVAFDNEVSLETFEELPPLFLARTPTLDQQVVITLDSVDYTHPPEQASSSGTRATLTFTASLSRK